ncbi:hypothetical protein FKM82_007092 [Ascaphus truei]
MAVTVYFTGALSARATALCKTLVPPRKGSRHNELRTICGVRLRNTNRRVRGSHNTSSAGWENEKPERRIMRSTEGEHTVYCEIQTHNIIKINKLKIYINK